MKRDLNRRVVKYLFAVLAAVSMPAIIQADQIPFTMTGSGEIIDPIPFTTGCTSATHCGRSRHLAWRLYRNGRGGH